LCTAQCTALCTALQTCLNNLGFMNSFVDAYSIAELNSRPKLRMQLEDCLKVANEKRRADKENNIKVKAKANFKLFEEPESAGWKGYSKVRAQLRSMIQFYGYGTNQSEKKYGAGPFPPFFPPSVDWASFKGPGKSSMETNTKIIVYIIIIIIIVYDLNDEIESEGSELNSSRLSVAQHIAGQGDSEDSWIVY